MMTKKVLLTSFALLLTIVLLQNAPFAFGQITEEEKPNFSLDFSLGELDEPLKQRIVDYLQKNPEIIPVGIKEFTLTVQYEDEEGVEHIAFVPTEVHQSNWAIPMTEEDIIRLELHGPQKEKIELFELPSSNQTNSPMGTNYRFPWATGDTWVKTQSFHSNTLGYSLDFAPNGNTPNALSIESGTLLPVCYNSDPYQSMVKVVHSGGVESGYLHLTKSTVPAGDFNNEISRGAIVGELFNQAVISNGACAGSGYLYNTPCGCATGMNLQFEANAVIELEGISLSTISGDSNGTGYTSADSIAPSASYALTSAGEENGWHTSDVQVEISAVDNSDGTGVDNVRYSINGANWQTHYVSSHTFTISTEGMTEVRYRAEDNAGNLSDVQVVNFGVDKTNPTLSGVTLNNGSPETQQVGVTAATTAADTHSGLWQMRLSNDGGSNWSSWRAYDADTTWSIPAVDQQTHTVTVQVRDLSGRTSTTAADSIGLNLHPDQPSSSSFRLCASTMNGGGQTGLQSSSFRLTSAIGDNTGGGTSSSANVTARSGFSAQVHGCRNACAVPTTPQIGSVTATAADMTISWNDVGADQYELWSGTNDAYFAPGSSCTAAANCTIVSGSTSATVSAGFGDPAQNMSYIIRAANACGATSGMTKRVGQFDFAVTPGD